MKRRKTEIFLENGKLVSKSNEIWTRLSDELDGKLTGRSLYSKLCEAKFREKLNEVQTEINDEKFESPNVTTSEVDLTIDDAKWNFDILINKELMKLIIQVEYNRHENHKNYMRYCLRLKQGEWEDLVSEEIYKPTKLECGFNFINHSLTVDATTGNINSNFYFYYKASINNSLQSKLCYKVFIRNY